MTTAEMKNLSQLPDSISVEDLESTRFITELDMQFSIAVFTWDENVIKSLNEIVNDIIANNLLLHLLSEIKEHDYKTYLHSRNVGKYSLLMGAVMGLSKEDLTILIYGALLHDIGKIFVPAKILNKKNTLADSERAIICQHPSCGYLYLQEKAVEKDILQIVLQHHEKYDGSGYPNGKSKSEIALLSQIVSVADVYDALTSDRPYRKAYPVDKAISMIHDGIGKNFNPEVVKSIMTSSFVDYAREMSDETPENNAKAG